MELKSMILPEKVVTFDFPGCEDLEFELAFLSKERNQKLLRDSNKTKINKKTRQPYEELDDDLFLETYSRAIIRGWKGFKLKYLDEFLPVDTSSFKAEDEMEYTEDNALELMKNSAIFDNWVSDQIGDLENFTKSNSKKKSVNLKNTLKKVAEV